MTDERFDAIVIGAGAAGLTCASTLAKAGLRVLLCGRKVQEAWGLDHSDALFGMEVVVLRNNAQAMIAFIPHPSGLIPRSAARRREPRSLFIGQ